MSCVKDLFQDVLMKILLSISPVFFALKYKLQEES